MTTAMDLWVAWIRGWVAATNTLLEAQQHVFQSMMQPPSRLRLAVPSRIEPLPAHRPQPAHRPEPAHRPQLTQQAEPARRAAPTPEPQAAPAETAATSEATEQPTPRRRGRKPAAMRQEATSAPARGRKRPGNGQPAKAAGKSTAKSTAKFTAKSTAKSAGAQTVPKRKRGRPPKAR